MTTNNILKLEIDNKTKHLEKHLRSQWTWKTYLFISTLVASLIFVTIDLEINFIELFSDSSKYFGDIFNRMLPPDFSNLNKVWENMLALPNVLDIFERAGGIIQPIVVDEKKLKEYVDAKGIEHTVKLYQMGRQKYYESLSTFSTFGRGWTRRVEETTALALKMI